ncbi:type II toxin-antitoxin system RelE/ParE family toxin [Enterobacter bugandensis]|uniref:type II toxin-antitoxin system RelE/ParE family toxin n=1 Tax=Enterobacter bugandensis TaxID=881260 RepID=UPI0025C8FA04|nr:type II toxin-antitoxin system RelE/ParE family toxin [Enterobacter bugandensis]
MSHAIEFIETSFFTRQIKSIATDDELKHLQEELIARSDKGDVIQHTGGLRKIRMAAGSKGKRGGVRVIYFLATQEVIYFIMAYPKSTKDSLTDTEKAELKKLTSALINTAFNAVYDRCTMYSIRKEETDNGYL